MHTAPSNPAPFDPAPDAADALLTALATDPHVSLADLAARHHTTLDALTLWTSRPDIAQRLASFDSLFAHRARLIAGGLLPQAIATLSAILHEFAVATPTDAPPNPFAAPDPALRAATSRGPVASPTLLPVDRLRAAETARRAASTLIRLSNFAPGPRRTPRPLTLDPAPLHTPREPARPQSPAGPLADPAALLSLLAALAAPELDPPADASASSPQPPTPDLPASSTPQPLDASQGDEVSMPIAPDPATSVPGPAPRPHPAPPGNISRGPEPPRPPPSRRHHLLAAPS